MVMSFPNRGREPVWRKIKNSGHAVCVMWTRYPTEVSCRQLSLVEMSGTGLEIRESPCFLLFKKGTKLKEFF